MAEEGDEFNPTYVEPHDVPHLVVDAIPSFAVYGGLVRMSLVALHVGPEGQPVPTLVGRLSVPETTFLVLQEQLAEVARRIEATQREIEAGKPSTRNDKA